MDISKNTFLALTSTDFYRRFDAKEEIHYYDKIIPKLKNYIIENYDIITYNEIISFLIQESNSYFEYLKETIV